ncbi:hypothetical protein BJX64DRAFT_85684 [Aspergillus heterothallicus]
MIVARESPSPTSDHQLSWPIITPRSRITDADGLVATCYLAVCSSFLGPRGNEWGRWRGPGPRETKISPLACGCFIAMVVGFGLIETPFRVADLQDPCLAVDCGLCRPLSHARGRTYRAV